MKKNKQIWIWKWPGKKKKKKRFVLLMNKIIYGWSQSYFRCSVSVATDAVPFHMLCSDTNPTVHQHLFNRGRCSSITPSSTHVMYCIVDHFEGGLLVVMINPSVAMENGHTLLLGPFTVTAVHTVIRPVIPLAGEDEQTLWRRKKTTTQQLVH